MRIAILVYGRLNKCAEHYNNILEHIGKQNVIDFFLSSDNSSENLLNDFIHLYKPILYNNDPIKYDCDLTKYPYTRPETNDQCIQRMTCHFINKYRVFSLLEEHMNIKNVRYDVVVSLRIDLVFQNSFDFNNLLDNTIYIPVGCDYAPNAINDQIAYGKIDVMKKYNSIFLNVIDLLEKNLTIPHPESITYANICFYKLQIERVNLKYNIDR